MATNLAPPGGLAADCSQVFLAKLAFPFAKLLPHENLISQIWRILQLITSQGGSAPSKAGRGMSNFGLRALCASQISHSTYPESFQLTGSPAASFASPAQITSARSLL